MTTTYHGLGTPTWRADDVAELAEANMFGRIDGTTRRLLPAGVEILCTPEWLAAYNAGHDVGIGETATAPPTPRPAPLLLVCNICRRPGMSTLCGVCKREARYEL